MEKVMEAVKEASISIACCLDEVEDVTQQDLEHIQDQITIIENYFKDIDDNCLKYYMNNQLHQMVGQ